MDTVLSRSGKLLIKAAITSTTPATNSNAKALFVNSSRETIEVIISDSRLVSRGSQFGHTAIVVDGREYGRAPSGWDTDTKEHYLYRQQVGMQRDSWGYVLKVTATEKQKILTGIHKRMSANQPYSLFENSCSSNIAEILEEAGIQAYDPRWTFVDTISPADLMIGLKHSRRLIARHVYPQK
ncbi:DUF4105 domain-containing protein [Burkholderia stagnalis]|uniref:DUF4105 domain-containing protein n=1 Tax=Burkholderia stagnalis TaxID=1503054 RepID=A0ABX9YNV7_9BURK|nr:DUF4105 domain-containing protein [Burkholderia stagnalis]RQQ59163.1 DUF4105 domain-containing protein [Burkholderia stagnalis]RQQ68385.1 DUF4105 domain-containing protein [Burkholderia stagnalis]RQQ69828.1 DUF4105 domain-containing protein [Burkholderia stagnalis]RQQ80386.1 DUF4105 domain-containing protein [Burkholderia stagnalis]RQQ89516.1 DUF4105 domain-containing protein [Burkholderia stagnalis]